MGCSTGARTAKSPNKVPGTGRYGVVHSNWYSTDETDGMIAIETHVKYIQL